MAIDRKASPEGVKNKSNITLAIEGLSLTNPDVNIILNANHNTGIGQTAASQPSAPAYGVGARASEGCEPHSKARELFAKNKDKPTTAAADPGTDLEKALSQADPKRIAQVFSGLVKQLNLVKSIMNAAAASKSSSGGPSQLSPSQQPLMLNSFYGALVLLVDRFGFEKVMEVFEKTLSGNKLSLIDKSFSDVIKADLSILLLEVELNGVENLTIPKKPPVVYGNKIPPNVVSSVPDLYIKQYYTEEEDLYQGYIEWRDQTNEIVIYTKRTIVDNPYPYIDDEILIESQFELFESLSPFIRNENLTIQILYSILISQNTINQNQSIDKTMGKNASQNLLQNLSKILGIIGVASNLAESAHLPNSVLNVGKIKKSLDEFSKSIGFLKTMQQKSNSAFNPLSALSGLASLPGLSDLASLSGLSGLASLPGLSDLASLSGLSGLANLASSLPGLSDLASSLPGLSELASSLPGLSQLASSLPGLSELASSLPGLSELASLSGGLSELTDLVSTLPGLSELSQLSSLPGLSQLSTKLPINSLRSVQNIIRELK
jgi:hypothetical protein